MENNLLRLKLKQRLNKLASNDFTNIECWQEAELVNKAQLGWTRRNLHGNNKHQEGDEQSTIRVDDFQILLKEKDLALSKKDLYFESKEIPEDYLKFKRVSAYASSKECESKRRMTISLVEEANIDELLGDYLLRPSFKWAETFCTLVGNRIRIYTNDEFIVESCKLTYFRMPRMISFAGCRDHNDQVTSDQELEFKDDLIELIIDEAVKIASADINDFNNYGRSGGSVEEGN